METARSKESSKKFKNFTPDRECPLPFVAMAISLQVHTSTAKTASFLAPCTIDRIKRTYRLPTVAPSIGVAVRGDTAPQLSPSQAVFAKLRQKESVESCLI